MCQMPNIWHIYHTKHKKHRIPDVPNPITFTTCEQYRCKFATVRNKNGIILIIFYSQFSLLSLHFHFIFFSSLSPVASILSILSFPFNLRSVWQWPLSPEAQAAWATSSPLMAHEPSSSPSLSDLIDLFLSLLVVVVFIVVDWLRFVDRRWCGFWVGVDVGFDVGFGLASMWVLGRRWCGFRRGFWVDVVGVRFGMGEGWWRLLRMIWIGEGYCWCLFDEMMNRWLCLSVWINGYLYVWIDVESVLVWHLGGGCAWWFFFFFFFLFCWWFLPCWVCVMVGWWWLLVRQWLLVAVVAAVVMCRCCWW